MAREKLIEKEKISEDNVDIELNFDSIKLQESLLEYEENLSRTSHYTAIHIVSTKRDKRKKKLAKLLIIQKAICDELNEKMLINDNQEVNAILPQFFTYESLDSTIDSLVSFPNKEQYTYITFIAKQQFILFPKWYDSTGFVGNKTQAKIHLFRQGCQRMHLLGLDELGSELFGRTIFQKQLMSIEQINEMRAKKLLAKEIKEKLGSNRLSQKERREIRKSKD